MYQKESWGAIVAPKEAHSIQRGQPMRMHGLGLWRFLSPMFGSKLKCKTIEYNLRVITPPCAADLDYTV